MIKKERGNNLNEAYQRQNSAMERKSCEKKRYFDNKLIKRRKNIKIFLKNILRKMYKKKQQTKTCNKLSPLPFFWNLTFCSPLLEISCETLFLWYTDTGGSLRFILRFRSLCRIPQCFLVHIVHYFVLY